MIDLELLDNEKAIRGIASRIQWYNPNWKSCEDYPYNTFTIRIGLSNGGDTELQKRSFAIRNPHLGLLFPAITIQAYLDEHQGNLLSWCVIKTVKLYDFIENHGWDHTMFVAGGNTMGIIKWIDIEKKGYKIIYHTGENK